MQNSGMCRANEGNRHVEKSPLSITNLRKLPHLSFNNAVSRSSHCLQNNLSNILTDDIQANQLHSARKKRIQVRLVDQKQF